MNEHSEEDIQDPFAPENIGVVQFIVLSRIYDVLMASLTVSNPSVAEDLLAAHARGELLGVSPYFNGRFVADDAE